MENLLKKVMIVDDNHLAVEGIYKNINWEDLGAEVVVMQYDGLSALSAVKEEPIDLIISDIEMPGLNGLEMSKEVIQINPHIKIILISAFDEFEYAKQAVRLGAYDYVEKPIDYDYLTSMVKNALLLIDKERNNLEILKKSRPAMISNFFSALIHSYSDEAQYNLSHYPHYLDLELTYKYYTVVTLDIENAVKVKAQIGIQDYHIQLMNLTDYTQECLKNFHLSYILNDLHGLVCILAHNTLNQLNFQQMVYEFSDMLSQHYQDHLLQINLGIGTVIKNLWDMHIAYESSRHALDYRFFFPQKAIFDVRDVLGNNLSLNLFTSSKEEQLIQLICKKDLDAIAKWIDNFSSELLEKYHTKNLLFIRIYSILGRILKLLYDIDVDSSDIEREIISVYSRLDSFTVISQIFTWLNYICKTTCEKLEASTRTYHKKMCESVLNYIKENYENSELCLNRIADFINVSPTHLSALYKKSTGQNISDIITSVRIDAACQLLLHTNLSLKEISEKTGYTNQYYFSSCFKKKMGKNPSSFRSEAQTS